MDTTSEFGLRGTGREAGVLIRDRNCASQRGTGGSRVAGGPRPLGRDQDPRLWHVKYIMVWTLRSHVQVGSE